MNDYSETPPAEDLLLLTVYDEIITTVETGKIEGNKFFNIEKELHLQQFPHNSRVFDGV